MKDYSALRTPFTRQRSNSSIRGETERLLMVSEVVLLLSHRHYDHQSSVNELKAANVENNISSSRR